MTIRERIVANIGHHARQIENLSKLIATSEFIEIEDEVGYPNEYGTPSITIEARDQEHAGEIIRKMLNKIGEVKKGFNEYTGQLYCTVEHDGTTVTINYGPSGNCKVKMIEVEEVIPESKVVTKKFVKEGDCDPIIKRIKE